MSEREFDHGELNIPGRLKNLDRFIDQQMEAQRKADKAEAKRVTAARKAAREAEAARPKLTADDVRGAGYIRDDFGWHRVVRVSAKSVTIATPYSWTDRIPLDKVLEVKR